MSSLTRCRQTPPPDPRSSQSDQGPFVRNWPRQRCLRRGWPSANALARQSTKHCLRPQATKLSSGLSRCATSVAGVPMTPATAPTMVESPAPAPDVACLTNVQIQIVMHLCIELCNSADSTYSDTTWMRCEGNGLDGIQCRLTEQGQHGAWACSYKYNRIPQKIRKSSANSNIPLEILQLKDPCKLTIFSKPQSLQEENTRQKSMTFAGKKNSNYFGPLLPLLIHDCWCLWSQTTLWHLNTWKKHLIFR